MLGIVKIPQNPGMEQFGRKNRLGATQREDIIIECVKSLKT